jgi:hypothetical protein
MARHAHGDGVEAGGGEVRDRAIRALGQDEGQRPRPERRREPTREACRFIGTSIPLE